MKRTLITVIAVFLLAGIVTAGKISFEDTYDNALKKAGDSNKKILITFKSPT
ncbi:MAG: hypothetical protein KAR42_01715 [candidate division Zixibacteria bacterium]|nr:hypothetical protein [candidate division Zixibacteria bacterium]